MPSAAGGWDTEKTLALVLLGATMSVVAAAGTLAGLMVSPNGLGFLGFGALAWVVGVGAKVVIHGLLARRLASMDRVKRAAWAGTISSISELGATAVVAAALLSSRPDWRDALAVGLGAGSFEALVLAWVALPLSLRRSPPKPLEGETGKVGVGAGLWAIARPAVERLIALVGHACSRMVVLVGWRVHPWTIAASAAVFASADGYADFHSGDAPAASIERQLAWQAVFALLDIAVAAYVVSRLAS